MSKRTDDMRSLLNLYEATVSQVGSQMTENDLEERAPDNPKAERFIKKHKAEFKKRYGKAWKRVLYALSWKKFGDKD